MVWALIAKNDPPPVQNVSREIPQAQNVIGVIQWERYVRAPGCAPASNCGDSIQPSHSSLPRRDWEHHDCAPIAHGWKFSVAEAGWPTRWMKQVSAVGERLQAVSRHHAMQSANSASHERMKARVDCENSKPSDRPAQLRPFWNRDVVQ